MNLKRNPQEGRKVFFTEQPLEITDQIGENPQKVILTQAKCLMVFRDKNRDYTNTALFKGIIGGIKQVFCASLPLAKKEIATAAIAA